MRAHRGALWCSVAALGAAASDATLWTVSTRGFQATCKGPELDAALARAASTKATLTATAPSHITNGDNWYAASGAAEAVDRFLTTRLEYVIAREPFDGGNVVELRYDSREVQLAQLWRRHQFERADACKRVVTLGQLATLGATLNKYDHVGMDTLRRGFSVQHPLSTKGWYMADHDANFCGAARGRWECFFLPWNNCGTHGKVEAALQGPTSAAAAKLLGSSSAFSGRALVEENDEKAEVFLCDRKEPSHAKCPPHTNAHGSSSKLVFPGGAGEHWDSDRRLALLHKALWHRPAFRLRRAIALEKRPFADDTSFVEAQSTGKCAFVYMRHGDKLYDRWVRTHKTRSFVVDFHRYAAEAVALLEGLFHTGGPYQLLALSDDGDVREDAQNLGPSVKARVAPATGIVSAHCRREGMDNLLKPVPRNVSCSSKSGERLSGHFRRGPRELARIYASLELSAPCDAVVHNYESSFVRVLYRDACARRGGKCPYTFSFGNARSPMDEKADERLGRTCTQPPTPDAVRKEFSFAARSCVPPAPTLPGISYWGDAAAAFFGRMEREASSEPVAATDKVARGGS